MINTLEELLQDYAKTKIFLTETLSGLMAGSRIYANTFEEAENKCPDGYRVIGELIKEIDAPEFYNFNLN